MSKINLSALNNLMLRFKTFQQALYLFSIFIFRYSDQNNLLFLFSIEHPIINIFIFAATYIRKEASHWHIEVQSKQLSSSLFKHQRNTYAQMIIANRSQRPNVYLCIEIVVFASNSKCLERSSFHFLPQLLYCA